ncbi:Ribosomal protein S5, eukaryotic/archaeal [Carpediemonas membranifera]|uniref:Small ribosomal subunit protein uS5 n=1 Tax=Carpediemonas membranifera TaxID=201153 RepID=A0A8J6DYN9_9EUKA|nr:Ribosomal protein S5, eukaryotic/archaeal [Carpediemonas membranifera]|eukprot:KAG9389603.1 Ribosomal protein S5, eukaryotic/archaeal [Carpediemonas membranifera]
MQAANEKSGDRRAPRAGFGARRPQRSGPRKEEWIPVTKLGRLVKEGKIKSLEEIYLHSMPIKEYQIVDHLFKDEPLSEEVLKVMSVQKQTTAGQRTRFKAFVCVGDHNRHMGLGIKVAKEVALAIRGAIVDGKLNLIPIRLGYSFGNIGGPHTVPMKVTGKAGSVRVRLCPAPRGSGIVAAPAAKKVLAFAGVQDVFVQSSGSTRTLGNFASATFQALSKTYCYLTPDMWAATKAEVGLLEKHSAFLASAGKK